MSKKTITLTESEFKKLVENSVREVLMNEDIQLNEITKKQLKYGALATLMGLGAYDAYNNYKIKQDFQNSPKVETVYDKYNIEDVRSFLDEEAEQNMNMDYFEDIRAINRLISSERNIIDIAWDTDLEGMVNLSQKLSQGILVKKGHKFILVKNF